MRHEMRLKLGAHLLHLCQPECSLLHSEDEARALSASSPWFALVDVPANFTSDLRHGPAPGVDQDWFQQVDNQSPQDHWAASVLPTPCCVDTGLTGRAAATGVPVRATPPAAPVGARNKSPTDRLAPMAYGVPTCALWESAQARYSHPDFALLWKFVTLLLFCCEPF